MRKRRFSEEQVQYLAIKAGAANVGRTLDGRRSVGSQK